MPESPADLLTRPAPAGAAFVCLALLDAARVAAQRLADPGDAEALHDFRVAVRRLRSILRSFRAELDTSVPRKLRNRLRDLTRATAPARDAEVLIDLVKTLEGNLARGRRAGVAWLLARLGARRDGAYERVRGELLPEFQKFERRLRKTLWTAGRRREAAGSEIPALGFVAGMLLAEHAVLLEQEIATLQSADDESTAHGIRITAKRLRYLLELLVGAEPRAAAVLPRVKELQTVLGDLHDMQVLGAQLANAVGDAAAERARRLHRLSLSGTPSRPPATREAPRAATTGILALARLVREAQDGRFGRFARDWQRGSRVDFWSELASVAESLASHPAPPPRVRPERALPRRANRRAVT